MAITINSGIHVHGTEMPLLNPNIYARSNEPYLMLKFGSFDMYLHDATPGYLVRLSEQITLAAKNMAALMLAKDFEEIKNDDTLTDTDRQDARNALIKILIEKDLLRIKSEEQAKAEQAEANTKAFQQ